MQIEVYKKEDLEKKQDTLTLYKKSFADKPWFIDRYYDINVKRNIMVVMKDGEKNISMLHLNPYLFDICGEEKTLYYMVAVCTDPEYRNNGYATKVINYALDYIENIKCPMTFLMPAYEELRLYYSRFGFQVLCDFTYDKFSKESYDMYPVRNEEFNNLMNLESKILKSETDDYKNHLKEQMIMAKVVCKEEMPKDIDFETLKQKKIYICQEV